MFGSTQEDWEEAGADLYDLSSGGVADGGGEKGERLKRGTVGQKQRGGTKGREA